MHFKSSGNDRQFWQFSAGLHAALILLGAVILYRPQNADKEEIKITIVETAATPPTASQVAVPAPQELTPLKTTPRIRKTKTVTEQPVPPKESKPVFGMDSKSLTDPNGEGPNVKIGNTLEKEPDSEKWDESLGPLPEPTDEFRVSRMPLVLSEVKAEYPPSAKSAGIEGPVVLEVLIDELGRVRLVKVLSGLGYGLDEAAIAALRKFSFAPAYVDQQAVAVKIRYTYRFQLD